MYNWAVYDIETSKLTGLKALSTQTEGVMPIVGEGHVVVYINQADFNGIMSGQFTYYNQLTRKLEPEIIRKLVLLTPGPFAAGIVSLQFEQQDLNGHGVIEQTEFTVTVNGQVETVMVEDGSLAIEIDCPEPANLSIRIEADRYEIVAMEVTISE